MTDLRSLIASKGWGNVSPLIHDVGQPANLTTDAIEAGIAEKADLLRRAASIVASDNHYLNLFDRYLDEATR